MRKEASMMWIGSIDLHGIWKPFTVVPVKLLGSLWQARLKLVSF